MKTKKYSSKIILLLLSSIAVSFLNSSCSNNSTEKQISEKSKAAIFPPPVSVILTNPITPRPDTCLPPRTIIVPTKNIGQTIAIENGKLLKLAPPEIKPADFFSQMQNYNTDNGLALDGISCSIMDKKGNLWFGTYGGGVSRYDGKAFTNYTKAQGLVNDNVWSILEDKTGNIWFGTCGGGVSCYNGKSFTNYTKAQGLANNVVASIMEDKTGNIWFGTDGGGVSRYDGKSFTNYTSAQGLSTNFVCSIMEDKTGNIWFGTDGQGVSRYDGRRVNHPCSNNTCKHDLRIQYDLTVHNQELAKSFTNYTTTQGLANNTVKSIIEDKKGNIWFATNGGGVSRYNGKFFTNFTIEQGLTNNSVFNIVEDKTGNIWLGTYGGGVSRYDGKSFTNYTTAQGLANNFVCSIIEDKTGNLWFGTNGGGVSCYEGKSFINYTTAQGLANNNVRSIMEDKTGSLWFGTDGGVVSCHDGQTKIGPKDSLRRNALRFTNYTEAQGLAYNSVWSIMEDKMGNLWFGTYGGGVSRYDGKSFTNYTEAQGLANNSVFSIAEDKMGNLWFGTEGGGVSRYDGKSFANYTEAQGLVNNYVRSIMEDKVGNFWFATDGGVSHYNGKSFTNYTEAQGLANNSVWRIIEDKMGNLWFCTTGGGISRYDGKSFANYTTTEGLPDNTITQALISKEQHIVLGTNLGIAMLTYFAPKERREKEADIIPAQNNLSNEELKKYTPVFEIYNTSTGYPVKDVNTGQNAMYKDSKGILWIATGSDKTALVRFDYEALNKNNKPPDVFIQGIKINNENICWNNLSSKLAVENLKLDRTTIPATITEEVTVFGKALSDAERDTMRQKFQGVTFDGITKFYPLPENLVLPYVHNHITFDFSAIEPAKPYLVRYQYLLEGYDSKWNPITNKTTAIFGNMYEGTYTFKLKARSPFGVWSEPIEYKFTVLPPWWRSWWMYTIYSLVFLSIIVSVYFYLMFRIRLIKKREEEKTKLNKQISDTEMKALRSQMNPHFIFNVMNSVQNYIVENDRVTAQDYLAKFARLMRHVLENSKAESITLENEIETLELYVMLEQLRVPGKFTFNIDVDPSITTGDTLIMPMLIQPFIENAITHGIMHKRGNEGRIEVTIKRSNDQLVCIIEDNGIGRKLSHKIKSERGTTHKSYGMNVTEERIHILNNFHGKMAGIIIDDRTDENMNSLGTKVTLTIPYTIQHNAELIHAYSNHC